MERKFVNETERFVFSVCERSFLSLWCEANPKGKDGDELCDILVVCCPHLIIISVKERQIDQENDPNVEHARWEKKTIEKSLKQIRGAERFLATVSRVVRKDGTPGLKLPPIADRKVHRIAVAFGGQGEVPIRSGDDGDGYVHVMSETGFKEILTELDTITDLTNYLEAKESSSASGCAKLIMGSEADLLALYLFNDRSFPSADFMLVDNTHWSGLRERTDYQLKKKAEEASYYWDRLIGVYAGPNRELLGEPDERLEGTELMLRTMARESRFFRRMLGRSLVEFFEKARANGPGSRSIRSPSGTIYVFVYFDPSTEREARCNGIGNRCYLARHTFREGTTVIGFGFMEDESGSIDPCEFAYLDTSDWSPEDEKEWGDVKAKINYDEKFKQQQFDEDEYPRA